MTANISIASPPDIERGTWDYLAGLNGTVIVAAGRRVLGIAAHSTTGGALTINGGNSVAIPASSWIGIAPKGNLVAPTIVFSRGVDSYFIESVA